MGRKLRQHIAPILTRLYCALCHGLKNFTPKRRSYDVKKLYNSRQINFKNGEPFVPLTSNFDTIEFQRFSLCWVRFSKLLPKSGFSTPNGWNNGNEPLFNEASPISALFLSACAFTPQFFKWFTQSSWKIQKPWI